MRNAPKVTCAARAISAPFEQDPRVSQGIFELIDSHKCTNALGRSRSFEKLMGVKSIEQAIEIQSQHVRRAYDTYMTEMSKLGAEFDFG
jgi:hypothetical protein